MRNTEWRNTTNMYDQSMFFISDFPVWTIRIPWRIFSISIHNVVYNHPVHFSKVILDQKTEIFILTEFLNKHWCCFHHLDTSDTDYTCSHTHTFTIKTSQSSSSIQRFWTFFTEATHFNLYAEMFMTVLDFSPWQLLKRNPTVPACIIQLSFLGF